MLATGGWHRSKGLPRPPEVLRDKENDFIKEPQKNLRSSPNGALGLKHQPSLEETAENDDSASCTDERHPQQVDENDLSRAEFERRVTMDADVVGAWCEYIHWTFQISSEAGKDLLKRACHILSADGSHTDDVRLLRLWVRLAGHLGEPLSVFEQLENQGIGLAYALRYEAQAAALERKHCFQEAEAQYILGLQRKAEPIERLEKALEEFHARMEKRASRKQKQASKQKCQEVRMSPSPSPPVKLSFLCPSPESFANEGAAPCEEQPLAQESVLVAVHGPQGEVPGFRDQAEAKLALGADKLRGHHSPDTDRQLPDDVSVDETQAALVLARFKQDLERQDSTPVTGYAAQRRASVTQELTTSGVRALLGDGRQSLSRRSSGGSVVDFEDPTYTTELEKREVQAMLAHHDTGPSHCELKPMLRVPSKALKIPSEALKPSKPARVPNTVTASPGGIGGMPIFGDEGQAAAKPSCFEIFEDD
mmetsp:Transcript_3389/g.6015  ORF Transcript_3389/g.6015 Transcript_3389/m.6015 type:complete len:479 (-) Transcript_3389:29-1465(-)